MVALGAMPKERVAKPLVEPDGMHSLRDGVAVAMQRNFFFDACFVCSNGGNTSLDRLF